MVVVRWRHPKKRHAQSPLVLLLHGRGADEDDLLDIADRMPSRFAFASLRAPVALPEGGFTWFESRGVARPNPASLRANAAELRDWIEEIGTSTYHGPLVLLGFSAGMMMAGALLHDEPTRYAGAVLLSGALDESALAGPALRLANVSIFSGSGALDAVIPHDLAARTQTYLRASGARLTAREYPIGHTIAHSELADIAAWLETIA